VTSEWIRGQSAGIFRQGLLLLIGMVVVRLAFQSGALTIGLHDQAPCPVNPRHARPYLFHFVPGLDEHRSWVEARVPEPDATDFVLCLDGMLMAKGIGQTPNHGIVQASIRTTWVDAQWLLGALDLYSASERWDIGYTTYTIKDLNPNSMRH
jgi:hypothetical protein